jgi:anti-sigma B factor antagonist
MILVLCDTFRAPPPGPCCARPAGRVSHQGAGMASQPARRRRLEVEDIGEVAVVNFVDKKILDEQNIQMIGDDLFRLVDELGRRKVLLNFSNVEFMSSAALGKLITLHRKLQGVQGKLVLCKIAKDILEVFKLTKLDRILTIKNDEQEGLQSF